MQEFRDYRAITELGIQPSEVEEMAAARLDWLLLIHDEVKKVEAEAKAPQAGGRGGRPGTL